MPPIRRIARPAADYTPVEDTNEETEEVEEEKSTGVRTGWAGRRVAAAQGGKFPDKVKLGEDPQLFKFMDDEPYAAYRQHWIEGLTSTGKKSFTCLGDNCPLCDIGDSPALQVCFNVINLSTGGKPKTEVLYCGVKASGQLESLSASGATGPLTKLYWAISTSGKGTKTAYNFQSVKERDVHEDYGVAPLTEEELAAFEDEKFDENSVPRSSKSQLQDIAEEIG